jgi:hypothetical protein
VNKKEREKCGKEKKWKIICLPLSVDFGDHEMVNSHNFRMALRWDHTAYYPPVIFPCLRAVKRRK